jgi:hypothetical protein
MAAAAGASPGLRGSPKKRLGFHDTRGVFYTLLSKRFFWLKQAPLSPCRTKQKDQNR